MLMHPSSSTVWEVCAVFPRQTCWPRGYIRWISYLWCHCLLSTGFIISITAGLCEQPPTSSSFSTSPLQCLKNLLCIHSLSWWVSRQCRSNNATTFVLAQRYISWDKLSRCKEVTADDLPVHTSPMLEWGQKWALKTRYGPVDIHNGWCDHAMLHCSLPHLQPLFSVSAPVFVIDVLLKS